MKFSTQHLLIKLFFISVCILVTKSTFAQYKIAEDLFLNISGNFPKKFSPSWDYVRPVENVRNDYKRIPVKYEDYFSGSGMNSTEINFCLGTYDNKAVVFWAPTNNSIFAADIVLPSKPFVISEKIQPFKLLPFRPVLIPKGGDKLLNHSDMNHYGGSISLSCNSKGDITISFILETYNIINKVSQRFTANNFIIPLKISISQAITYSSNEKYTELLESFVTQKYEGWKYDKIYMPNSIKNIVVMEKDNLGKPIRIHGECNFELYGKTQGWIEILLNNDIVFGVAFWDYPEYILTPKLSRYKKAYTTQELKINDQLQNKYLYNRIFGKSNKLDNFQKIKECLEEDTITNTEAVYKDVPEFQYRSDGSGSYISGTHKEYSHSITTKSQILINKCKNSITIYGIRKYKDHNALIYEDVSFKLDSGETTSFKYLKNNFNPTTADYGTHYFINN